MIETTGCFAHTQTSIETFSGVPFDLLNPKPEMVRIVDIAHHLAGINRYVGATRTPYNVAEHSVQCHDMAAEIHGEGDVAFACLMHDAHEAYGGDDSRPKKMALDILAAGVLHDFHERIQAVVRKAFGIVWDASIEAEVKRFDNIMCRAEAHLLMESRGATWGWGEVPLRIVTIQPWGSKASKIQFLDRFERYRK